jgi:hypothetical protein
VKVQNSQDKQTGVVKKLSRLLYDSILTKNNGCPIMDEETHVKVNQNQIPEQMFYTAIHRLSVLNKYKYLKVVNLVRKYSFGRQSAAAV